MTTFLEDIPWYKRMFVRVRVDPALAASHPLPIENAAAIRAPLLVVHGRRDGTIPVRLGEKLFAAATASLPKQFCRVDDADHNDLGLANPQVRGR